MGSPREKRASRPAANVTAASWRNRREGRAVRFRLAATSNAEATTAKKRFVRAFNPLADQFGRRTWSAGEI